MLSAFSNILPAALSEKLEKLDLRGDNAEQKRQQQQQPEDEEDVKQKNKVAAKKEKEKKKKSTTNENFIIVRPPPAKTNHPLNLQVQLVPAYTPRERSNTGTSIVSTLSTDGQQPQPQPHPPSPAASESEQGHGLRRSPSNRSNRSDFYSNGSTGSVTSFASTSTSTSSGRRMIIPLYNLHAHNVLTNTILDAGTDARVAKFHKRGLEVIGLGVLEPQEVWVSKTGAGAGAAGAYLGEAAEGITRTTSRNSLAPPPAVAGLAMGNRAETPDPSQSPSSSRLSLSSERTESHIDLPAQVVMVVPPTPVAATGAKKFFGKIFKRKGEGSPGRAATMPSVPASEQQQQQQQDQASSPSSPTPSHLSHISQRSYTHTQAAQGQSQAPLLLIDGPATPVHSAHHTPQPSYESYHPQGHAAAAAPPPPSIPLTSILGLTPTLHPTSLSPHPLLGTTPPRSSTFRTSKIIWTMRKWLKEEGGAGSAGGFVVGVLGKVAREVAAGAGVHAVHGNGRWEVRWEWVKGGEKEKRREEKRRERRGSAVGVGGAGAGGEKVKAQAQTQVQNQSQTLSGSRRNSVLGEEDGVPVFVESPRGSLDRRRSIGGLKKGGEKEKEKRRASWISGGRSAEDVTDEKGGGGEEDGTEDGYESDPEDSETPWTCSLVVEHVPQQQQVQALALQHTPSVSSRRHSRNLSLSSSTGHAPAAATHVHSPTDPGSTAQYPNPAFPTTKVKIATLSPAPHHPKVVCQLRIPFPLPDVQISRGSVCKRIVLPDGSTRTTVGGSAAAGGGGVGLVLTAEEIKDVVCSTACWLVVREGIGGVGKVNRKGDGWRIRG